MSGHSKWATIKRQKGKTDAQRGKLFTKLGREIAVAVKAGGGDPDANSRLREVIAKAKASNMPSDNITRSIKKASGELGSINYEPITYEGYGPNGMAVMVECLTDNKNRTAAEVRHIFDKAGGAMGTSGCVSFMFESKGIILLEKTGEDDEVMLAAVEAGAEDFEVLDDCYQISTAPTDLEAVKNALKSTNLEILSAEVDKIPSSTVDFDENSALKVRKMLASFEDDDDVQTVFHNAILPDEE